MNGNLKTGPTEGMRHLIVSLEEENDHLAKALHQARGELVKAQAQLLGVNRPSFTLEIFLNANITSRQVEAAANGRHMRLAVSPSLDLRSPAYGQHIRIDDSLVAVVPDRFQHIGSIVSVLEFVEGDRILVSREGGQEHILFLAGPIRHSNLCPGDSLMVGLHSGIALEHVIRSDVEQSLTPEVPDTSYRDIGGLNGQVAQVRGSIELPFIHPETYRAYGLRPPKGILLCGPSSSGKTLIAKAVVDSLSKAGSGKCTYFLLIKGPELPNKFIGETERQIRVIFSRARLLAAGDVSVIVSFDGMETLLGTRGTGVSSDVEIMIVPQLLVEMDGIEALDNVVIIGALNRADMTDPAVLRPGRLDVRIRVERPDRVGVRDIFTKYLTPRIPIREAGIAAHGSFDVAVNHMIDQTVERLFVTDETSALFDARLASGRTQRIYFRDIISGAMITGIVERTKKLAIKDALKGKEHGLSMAHILSGVYEEIRESVEPVQTSSPEDWTRAIDLREEIVTAPQLRGGDEWRSSGLKPSAASTGPMTPE